MSNWIGDLTAWIPAVIVLVICVWLAWRQQRRVQTQLDSLSSAIRRLELAHEGLLVRFLNLPMSRKTRNARKSSSPSSYTLEERMAAPTQPDEKNSKGSALYVVAPKTSPE